MKFFTPEGATTSEDITAILESAENVDAEGIDIRSTRKDYLGKYAAGLAELIRKQTNMEKTFSKRKDYRRCRKRRRRFFLSKRFLRPLGADTVGCIHLETQRHVFLITCPIPGHESVIEQFSVTVAENKADFGHPFSIPTPAAPHSSEKNGVPFSQTELQMILCAIVLEEKPRRIDRKRTGLCWSCSSLLSRAKGGVVCEPQGNYRGPLQGNAGGFMKAGSRAPWLLDIHGFCALREKTIT